MAQEYLCVSIPEELKCYKKSRPFENKIPPKLDFNSKIEVIKDDNGHVKCSKFYDEDGLISKILHYTGSLVTKKCRYKDNKLRQEEEYSQYGITSKISYDKDANIIAKLSYMYNKQGRITSISKLTGNMEYKVNYGYDDLQRVNSREIILNKETINHQKFRFDILDRVVEFQDKNQRIRIQQISPKNELIYYIITDRMGNEIYVTNYFGQSDNSYIKTDIILNGHKITLKDTSYVDNIMLKKPYTTEDDLDLIISNLFKTEYQPTKRTNNNDNSNNVIDINIKMTTLPISIRKRLLYNLAVNS